MIRTSKPKLAFWAAALVGGAYLGYQLADSLARDSGFAMLGALFVGVLILAILFVLGIVAAAVGLQPDRRGRPAARAVIVSGALLVVGVAVGWVTTPVLGLGYRPPLLFEASGTMSLALDGLDGFASEGDAAAFCRSEPDSDAIATVDANAVGRVATGTVTASVRLDASDLPDSRPIFVFGITPAVKGEDAAPNWRGAAEAVQLLETGRGGSITFTEASLVEDETGRLPNGWPGRLSGTLSWSCDAWSQPGSSALP